MVVLILREVGEEVEVWESRRLGILKADDDDSRFLHGDVQDNVWLRE